MKRLLILTFFMMICSIIAIITFTDRMNDLKQEHITAIQNIKIEISALSKAQSLSSDFRKKQETINFCNDNLENSINNFFGSIAKAEINRGEDVKGGL